MKIHACLILLPSLLILLCSMLGNGKIETGMSTFCVCCMGRLIQLFALKSAINFRKPPTTIKFIIMEIIVALSQGILSIDFYSHLTHMEAYKLSTNWLMVWSIGSLLSLESSKWKILTDGKFLFIVLFYIFCNCLV